MTSRFDAAFFTLQTLTRLEDKFFDNEEKLAEIRALEIRTAQRIEDISEAWDQLEIAMQSKILTGVKDFT